MRQRCAVLVAQVSALQVESAEKSEALEGQQNESRLVLEEEDWSSGSSRYSLYLLYWYKSTNADAEGAAGQRLEDQNSDETQSGRVREDLKVP